MSSTALAAANSASCDAVVAVQIGHRVSCVRFAKEDRVNRQQRRAARIKDPKGNYLYPTLLHVVDRDHLGRPTNVRITYDEETLTEVGVTKDKAEMLLVWMAGERQGASS